MFAITPIPAFNDNYLWLIDNGVTAIIIDPGDEKVIIKHLKAHQLTLAAILITHHHHDHIDGVAALKELYRCPVYGPNSEKIPGIDVVCEEHQSIQIENFPVQIQVIEVPGHTLDHIAYYIPKSANSEPLLFCGDTLFSGGCGRLFEGSAAQMWHSIKKLMALPETTLIYPAHEYTQSNLNFAQHVEPNNLALKDYTQKVSQLRSNNTPTLPTLLSREKQINPFMRIAETSVITSAEKRIKDKNLAESQVFATIRSWKDNF